MGHACPVPPSGSGLCLVSLRIFTHACFVVRFYAHRHRPDGDAAEWSLSRTMEPLGGPAAGWGSILCCWSGCHITPCGDDCAIYCLAGAGDRRRWNRTGPSVRLESRGGNIRCINEISWENVDEIKSFQRCAFWVFALLHVIIHAEVTATVDWRVSANLW